MFAKFSKFLKSFSNYVLNAELFLSQVLIPFWILTLYFVSFSWLLPEGVNKDFVTRSGKFTLLITCVLSLAFFTVNKLRRGKISFPQKSKEKFSTSYLALLLLPLAPVMQYIINNFETLSLIKAFYVFFVFAVLIAFFVLFIPFLLSGVSSTRMLMFLGLAFTFSLTNMAALSRQFAWHEVGSLKIQLTIFTGVFLLGWLFFYFNYEKFFYLLAVLIFITTTTTQLLAKVDRAPEANQTNSDNRLVTLVDSRKPIITPNIYLLIYDAYVGNETTLAYGIDNRAQEQYLEELGFTIYPHTYSIGFHSIGTMSRVLNASTEFYGDLRKGVSGDGVVQNLLEEIGYKTCGIFNTNNFFLGIAPNYDYSFPSYSSPSYSSNLLIKAILEGEFRFDLTLNVIPREQFLDEKKNLFSSKSSNRRFIYMHSNMPGHSQNSGACLPNEFELFNDRLLVANLEMKQDLEMIIENDHDAIIIVAGDHGPYLTKNCTYISSSYDISEISRLDIQDRYGTFLAIRWPSQDFEKYDDIVVLQDIFPVIFAYIYQDPKLLDAKVETVTLDYYHVLPTSGATVIDGIIHGGINDGEHLFIDRNK